MNTIDKAIEEIESLLKQLRLQSKKQAEADNMAKRAVDTYREIVERPTVAALLRYSMLLMGEHLRYERDYVPHAVAYTNNVLADCLEANNAARKMKDKEPISTPPFVSGLEDVLACEPEIIQDIMPVGVAYWMCMQDEENAKAGEFYRHYRDKLSRAGDTKPGA